MTIPIDSSGVSGMLSEALSALGRLQAQSDDAVQPEPPAGTGEAADGLIGVRAVMPGRIEELRLDPRVLRMASADLAREIEAAVNAALAELRDRAAVGVGATDLGGLADQLKELQESAERGLSAFTASMAEAQGLLARRAGGR